jgi:MFS family permease
VYGLDSASISAALRHRGARRPWSSVPANVWCLGATSLLTDVSSEMVASILPLYLVLNLHFTPMAFGIVDGLYQGIAAVTRSTGGLVADRFRAYKPVAAAGYALSAIAKLGLLQAGAAPAALATVIMVDRLGKGVRTAPRDALIAMSAEPRHVGTSFGVHRALDAAGAMLGPLLAFALLARIPGRFDVIFTASFWVAVVGLAVLLLFVHGESRADRIRRTETVPIRAALAVVRVPGFIGLWIAASALAAATVGDSFVYLTLQQTERVDAFAFPLLYIGTPLVYFLLASPLGAIADRVGSKRTFLAGHLALVLLYLLIAGPAAGRLTPLTAVVLLGGYYAATDGALAALVSRGVPEHMRASGLALVATGVSIGRAAASLMFGVLWTSWGRQAAVLTFAVALSMALGVAVWFLWEPFGADADA